MRVTSKVALRGLRSQRQRTETLAQAAPAGVRVVPQEKYRAVLKHPRAGGFPAEGGKEWPHDRFTKRRLVDGSVALETEAMRTAAREARPKPKDKDKETSSSAA